MTREYSIRHKNNEWEVLQIEPLKPKTIIFKGDIEKFDFKPFAKRLKSSIHLDYLMRCCIASFCYGVYVRLLF